MAKINRYNGNLQAFASAAPGTERTIFGDVTQANDLTSQITANFLRGWGIVGPSDQPALEDFNGAMFTHGQLLAYLHQAGLPEYNAAQEYFIGSATQVSNDIYISLQASNIGNAPASSPTFWRNISAQRSTLGVKTLVMDIPSVSASTTITAEQVTMGEGLTGRTYRVDSFSKIINLAGTGVGGMDTGAAPASGFVSIYAIYNPTTGVSALLACNSTTSSGTTYSGANMPAGYTASLLVSALRTTAASLFEIAYQKDNEINIASKQIVNLGIVTAVAPFSLALIVPPAAKSVSGLIQATSNAGTLTSITLQSTIGLLGRKSAGCNSANLVLGSYSDLLLSVPQSIFVSCASDSGGSGFAAFASVTSYKI